MAAEVEVVTSADGTSIAYERTGSGPALILVDAALHYRAFSSFEGLIGLLKQHFTVFHYDRRGRGDSADTPPYAVAREVEDLAALIDRAGGSACVFGFSSGGLLALHAAAGGTAITRLALLEPPIATEDERPAQAEFTAAITRLLAAGQRSDAVDHVLRSVGLPEEMLAEMRDGPAWSAMEAVAHTLVYDSTISEQMSYKLLASVAVPTLVLDSRGSGSELTGMAATVAARLPNAVHQSLPGQWHGVADDVLAPALREFLAGA
ncbi:alpha/beta hydrolase [Kribbella sancticallisti]|uniref:Alpha/beta hydrolase n=1 Tax=Kribbella sancticallisti TaxID=460087 RepID=A0ABP4QRI5_9ACTN